MEEKLDKLLQMQEIIVKDISILKQDVSSLNTRVDYIEKDHGKKLQELSNHICLIEKEHGKKLETLSNHICIIEEEHGKKLQALLERDVDYVRRQVYYAGDLVEINHTLQEHDARLYVLENPA